MPRTLPWLNEAPKKKKSEGEKSSPPPPKRRKRDASSDEDLVDADLNDIATPPPRLKQKKRADRTPSTSPAPAPSSNAKLEEMRPGWNADDIYMMVEDQFVEVAKEFSKHIHHAEYVRLKKLAKARGKRTLAAVNHGTDGKTEKSTGLRNREEREASERKREGALGADAEESDGAEDPFMQDPQLAGLMMKDKSVHVGRELAGLVKAKSNTRAAAGFSQSPHTAKRYRDAVSDEAADVGEERQKPAKASGSRAQRMFEEVSDDEDDLDAVTTPRVHSKPEAKSRATNNNHRASRPSKTIVGDGASDGIFKPFARPSKEPPRSVAETSATKIPIDDDDILLRPRPARLTYKKAQNRQAAQAIKVEEEPPRRTLFQLKRNENARSDRPATTSNTREPGHAKGTGSTSSATLSPEDKNPSTAAIRSTSPIKDKARLAAEGYLAKRNAERARKEKEQQGRAKRYDDIPTFLY